MSTQAWTCHPLTQKPAPVLTKNVATVARRWEWISPKLGFPTLWRAWLQRTVDVLTKNQSAQKTAAVLTKNVATVARRWEWIALKLGFPTLWRAWVQRTVDVLTKNQSAQKTVDVLTKRRPPMSSETDDPE